MDKLADMVAAKNLTHPVFGLPTVEQAVAGVDPSAVFEIMKTHCPHLIKEATEVLVAAGFEFWKKDKEPSLPAVREELVDVLHITISLLVVSGLDADGIYSAYMSKHHKNLSRMDWKGR
jgi:phosphoribosyl-ATP pyrophosphohydrolase